MTREMLQNEVLNLKIDNVLFFKYRQKGVPGINETDGGVVT